MLCLLIDGSFITTNGNPKKKMAQSYHQLLFVPFISVKSFFPKAVQLLGLQQNQEM